MLETNLVLCRLESLEMLQMPFLKKNPCIVLLKTQGLKREEDPVCSALKVHLEQDSQL